MSLENVVTNNLLKQKQEEQKVFKELKRAYQDIERALMEEADKVFTQLDSNSNKMFEHARINILLDEVRREMQKFADDYVKPTVASGMVQSSYLGSQQAEEAFRSIYGDVATGYVLPIPSINAFVRQLETGPLGRLFDSFGDDAANKARATMLRSITLGYNPKKTASELRHSLGTNRNRALLIARTETMRAHREGNRQYYQQRGVQKWVWHADLGPRTCAACWALHGQEFDINERMGAHPACRCTMVPKVESWRDMGYSIDGDSYIEEGSSAFEKQPESTKKRVLGSKYEDYKQGNVKLTDFVAVKNSAYGKTYTKKVPR